jgi:hypothetical protein
MGTAIHDSFVLTSWKEIAQYLGKGVRTVQRWEQELGLPVRRPTGPLSKRAVLARPDDLDAWMAIRWLPKMTEEKTQLSPEMHQKILSTLNNGIQTSRALRLANRALVDEMRTVVDELIHSSYELSRLNSRPFSNGVKSNN